MEILISDINTGTLEDIAHTIKTHRPDWQLTPIESGKKCLDIVMNGKCPDVIILGNRLSDMPVLDLIGQIREDSDVPIVVLSCNKDDMEFVMTLDAGANDHVVTPVNGRIFVAKLKAIVRRREWNKLEKKRVVNK